MVQYRITETLKPRQHFLKEIWKHSFISIPSPTVHTNPEKLFTKNGDFEKHSTNWRNLKTLASCFLWKKNILKTELDENAGGICSVSTVYSNNIYFHCNINFTSVSKSVTVYPLDTDCVKSGN